MRPESLSDPGVNTRLAEHVFSGARLLTSRAALCSARAKDLYIKSEWGNSPESVRLLFAAARFAPEIGVAGFRNQRGLAGADEEHVTGKACRQKRAACQGLHNALILAYGTVTKST